MPRHLGPLLALAGLVAAGIPMARGAGNLVLEEPRELQVVQRSEPDLGNIPISGVCPSAVDGAELEARLGTTSGSNSWRVLTSFTNGQTRFRTGLQAPAGGWQSVQVRIRRGAEVLFETEVAHVGVGEVFVVAGQSNSANHGEERQRTASGLVSVLAGDRWQAAHDPQPGASGDGGSFIPPFADAMASRFGVPVGIVAVGAGGTSVREWLPRGSRFPNPPTVMGNVQQASDGTWESRGLLFDTLSARLRALGPRGARAVLWHQGESDAHQQDPTRTLSGTLYAKFLEQLIDASQQAAGWKIPWFVAQVSYHTPDDPGSPDIRSAQASLWNSGIAFEGPDTDTLTAAYRDGNGKGVHFNGHGLRTHARLWTEKVSPWLESLGNSLRTAPALEPRPAGGSGAFEPPGLEPFSIGGHRAFVFLPPPSLRRHPQPWILYAPTLPGLPDGAERWMHERFLSAGIAVAGVDVGEGYGSPKSHAAFDLLHRELVEFRGFAARPCLLGRSRGGLWVTSWAIAHPDRVAGIAGIYPVFDLRSYPGLARAASAYGLTPDELGARSAELNPVERVSVLAAARVPVMLIHGDADTVVPLPVNSGEVVRRYQGAGAESLIRLITLPGEGHNFSEAFFRNEELVEFAIARARAGAGP
ncbi:MAG: prolyl oligopeptidase family serine peptidase [Verrucomicrobiales bacterium]|nr:prolyl oligopeptidase family serine peptidase [Verrucomicrobiales bacterium]